MSTKVDIPMSTPPSTANRLFYSLDESFRFTYVSPEAAALWDWPEGLLLGQVIWDVFPTAKESPGYARHLEAMTERRMQAYDVYSPRHRRWYDFTIHPLDNGGLMCFFEESPGSTPPQGRPGLAV